MMPYDTYRLYQVERAKSCAEVRRADEQLARLASAASSLFRRVTRPARAVRGHARPQPAAYPTQQGSTRTRPWSTRCSGSPPSSCRRAWRKGSG